MNVGRRRLIVWVVPLGGITPWDNTSAVIYHAVKNTRVVHPFVLLGNPEGGKGGVIG